MINWWKKNRKITILLVINYSSINQSQSCIINDFQSITHWCHWSTVGYVCKETIQIKNTPHLLQTVPQECHPPDCSLCWTSPSRQMPAPFWLSILVARSHPFYGALCFPFCETLVSLVLTLKLQLKIYKRHCFKIVWMANLRSGRMYVCMSTWSTFGVMWKTLMYATNEKNLVHNER